MFVDLFVSDVYRFYLVLFLCSCFGGFVLVSVLAEGSFGRLLVGVGVFFADFFCFWLTELQLVGNTFKPL